MTGKDVKMAEVHIRYTRQSDIIELLVFMAHSSVGVSIDDIEKRYNVSRRTAERMRDSLLNIFPQIDITYIDGKKRFWGITDVEVKKGLQSLIIIF